MKQKRSFYISIPEFALGLFILTCLTSFLFPGLNQALYDGGTEANIIFPEFTPYNPTNGWPRWKQMGFVPLSGLIVAIAGALCLDIIRSLLPEKLKPYLSWKIPKFDD